MPSDTPFFRAHIVRITGEQTKIVTLRLEEPYAFAPGQYTSVQHSSSVSIPLSIASVPSDLPELILHYRSNPGDPSAAAMDELLNGSILRLEQAMGEVVCPSADIPLLIVAGGTGASQAFSCAEHREQTATAPTQVLWCVDHQTDIYLADRLESYRNVHWTVQVDDRRTPENEGLQWLNAHAEKYRDYQVIIAGSPGFVYLVSDILLEQGFDQSTLHADAYSYAPR